MKMRGAILSLLVATGIVSAQRCYSVDGNKLDSRYQPCYPQAESSACCMLNGTQGSDQQNDLCLDSGLCQSTSGWYAGFLYINGCTDPTGKADGCAKICNAFGNQYSWSVLQCEPGKFCCRAASDTGNCCGSNRTMISTSHIGSLLLPGSTAAINTTFNFTTNSPTTSNGSSGTTCLSSNTSANTTNATCPTDRSGVVGGAVGGILGAALIASLVALLFAVKSRQHHRSDLNATSAALQSAETLAAHEKAHFQSQLAEQQYVHSSSAYAYGSPQSKAPTYSVMEMPQGSHGVGELEERASRVSELPGEQRKQ